MLQNVTLLQPLLILEMTWTRFQNLRSCKMKYLTHISYMPIQKSRSSLRFIRERPKPLALYCFTADKDFGELILRNTSSGGAILNDVVVHLSNEDLPFGGVGDSAWVFITEENLSMRLRTKSLFFDERQSWMLPFDTHRTALSSRS